MAPKKVNGYVKLQVMAAKATPAPPIGPALGQAQARNCDERSSGLLACFVFRVVSDEEIFLRDWNVVRLVFSCGLGRCAWSVGGCVRWLLVACWCWLGRARWQRLTLSSLRVGPVRRAR